MITLFEIYTLVEMFFLLDGLGRHKIPVIMVLLWNDCRQHPGSTGA
jgi:hypothetical protein